MALGQSDIPRVYEVENTGSQLAKPVLPEPDQLPVIRELPDPLEGVTSFADWQKRRSDIAHMIQHYGSATLRPDDRHEHDLLAQAVV